MVRFRFSLSFRNSFRALYQRKWVSTDAFQTEIYLRKKMNLDDVVSCLNSFAPLPLAADWDNVGLLIEPSTPRPISKIMLTNDLTKPVFDEAIDSGVQLIITYHPLIFQPLKKLTQKTWKEKIITRCLEERIAVYSPHTCWDAAIGGVNDWLVQPFNGKVEPLSSAVDKISSFGEYRLEFTIPEELAENLLHQLTLLPALSIAGVKYVMQHRIGQDMSATRVCLSCNKSGLSQAIDYLSQFEQLKNTIEVIHLDKLPLPGAGFGRLTTLYDPISLNDALNLVKKHLGLQNLRLAKALNVSLDDKCINSVAVCAGAGGTVLKGVKASLYLTGEMLHHDLLDATHRGISVILTDHSNSERGFLLQFQSKLKSLLENRVEILVSKQDCDPLFIVT